MKTYYRVDLYTNGKIEITKTTEEEYDSWGNHCCYFMGEKGSGISVFGASLKKCYEKLKPQIIKQIKNKQNEIKELKTLLSKIETKEK